MEINKKIAKWLGWCFVDAPVPHFRKLEGVDIHVRPIDMMPDYEHSDSDAVTLLPILVERGYYPALCYHESGDYKGNWVMDFGTDEYQEGISEIVCAEPTIAAAITSAIIQLIDREANNDQ